MPETSGSVVIGVGAAVRVERGSVAEGMRVREFGGGVERWRGGVLAARLAAGYRGLGTQLGEGMIVEVAAEESGRDDEAPMLSLILLFRRLRARDSMGREDREIVILEIRAILGLVETAISNVGC